MGSAWKGEQGHKDTALRRDLTIFRTRKTRTGIATSDWHRVRRPGLARGAYGRLQLCTAGRAPASRTRGQGLGKRHRSKSRVRSGRWSSSAAARRREQKQTSFCPKIKTVLSCPGPLAPAPAGSSRTAHAPPPPPLLRPRLLPRLRPNPSRRRRTPLLPLPRRARI